MCASNPALFMCNIIWMDASSQQSLRGLGSEGLSRALPEFGREIVDKVSGLAAETHRGME